MFGNGLRSELWRLVYIFGACLVLGLLTESAKILLLVALSGYIAWLLFQIHKLGRWINDARKNTLEPGDELTPFWTEVTYDVQLMLNRHEKEKQRLQSVVHRVQDMTTALTDSVVLIDRRGNIDWWNAAAEGLFELRASDRGHKVTNFVRQPEFIKYFEADKYQQPLELTMWRRDLHLEFQVHRFGDGERVVIVRDITRLFRLEQMRKDFVANVSHELRTPLTVIQGYVETLANTPDTPPPWRKAMGQMLQQCKRMTLLINDLITLSKLETDEIEAKQTAVDLRPLVESIVADVQPLSAEKNHRLSIQGGDNLHLTGSERELRSAISNLIVNAINYSDVNGAIDIIIQKLTHETVVSVKDTGLGIDAKHLPRITERFYRVDQSRSVASGGTGLGLAIVKHVLLRHNAELQVTSRLGKGSTFSCHFPVINENGGQY